MGKLRPNGGQRIVLVVALAVALSACGSSSPTTLLLKNSDIPSYLRITINPAATALVAREEASLGHGCPKPHVAVFTAPGSHIGKDWLTNPKTLEVISSDSSCTDTSGAHAAFRSQVAEGGMQHSVSGIGNEAESFHIGTRTLARDYGLAWREAKQIGLIFVLGPPKDTRVNQGWLSHLPVESLTGRER